MRITSKEFIEQLYFSKPGIRSIRDIEAEIEEAEQARKEAVDNKEGTEHAQDEESLSGAN